MFVANQNVATQKTKQESLRMEALDCGSLDEYLRTWLV
jgi:hypothetical protein